MKNTNHVCTTSLSHGDKLEARRLKAAKLFKKGLSQAEVARQLDVSREATRQWYNAWKKKGDKGLASKGKPGPEPKLELTEAKIARVEQALLKGPRAYGFQTEIWTLQRIAKVIHKVFKVKYHPGHLWYILQSIKWSCQKPARKNKERNEKKIAHWKHYTWPNIKKRGEN